MLSHIACGLRTVMLAHGTPPGRANRVCRILIAASLAWTVAIVAGMLGVRI